ncbi:MAG: Fic family protein [Lachnospiraceae bacterium]|nr:Fic family protein [Lachnospiraceae bacterium]
MNITDKEEMSSRLAFYLGELNMIHPFRDGNGRTQRIYIEQLCMNNGRFDIYFTEVTKDEMISASVISAENRKMLILEFFFITTAFVEEKSTRD